MGTPTEVDTFHKIFPSIGKSGDSPIEADTFHKIFPSIGKFGDSYRSRYSPQNFPSIGKSGDSFIETHFLHEIFPSIGKSGDSPTSEDTSAAGFIRLALGGRLRGFTLAWPFHG